jgi:uncharacterized protein (TIGR02996 family)
MDNEATLLSAIAADPADALAWRALADWLEEDGQPDRAELARLTLRLRMERRHRQHRRWQERVQTLLAGGVQPCVPEVVNSIGMRFVLVPAGSFRMGSPEGEDGTPDEVQHEVQLTGAFWVGAFPVTQAQFRAVTGRSPSAFGPRGAEKDRVAGLDTGSFPVDSVSWTRATNFCRKLAAREEERAAGRSYRLPTDAEWEYACRAGTTTAFCTGKKLTTDRANIAAALDGGRPCPVGSYPPNAWALYDLHGQVWEWCADWYADRGEYYALAATDPRGPARGTQRILRGGTYNDDPRWCRAAYRNADGPTNYTAEYGFRVVCAVGAA